MVKKRVEKSKDLIFPIWLEFRDFSYEFLAIHLLDNLVDTTLITTTEKYSDSLNSDIAFLRHFLLRIIITPTVFNADNFYYNTFFFDI